MLACMVNGNLSVCTTEAEDQLILGMHGEAIYCPIKYHDIPEYCSALHNGDSVCESSLKARLNTTLWGCGGG